MNHPPPPRDSASASLRALIRSARGQGQQPLRIERRQGKLEVVLPSDITPGSNPDPSATAPETQVLLMQRDLQAHLDRCAQSRAALPHLMALEHKLDRRGMRAFEELSLPVLRRAAGQLQGLAQQPVLEGFALLQARLDIAIVAREETAAVVRKPHALSSFFVDHKLQVSETSMSNFMRIAGFPPTEPMPPPDNPD